MYYAAIVYVPGRLSPVCHGSARSPRQLFAEIAEALWHWGTAKGARMNLWDAEGVTYIREELAC